MQKVNGISWYSYGDGAIAGAKADTTLDVVDSSAVELAEGLEPGQPVARGTDKAVHAKLAETSVDVIGVAVHTHKEPNTPYYGKSDSIGVMTFGRIWVEVAVAVTAGDKAAVNATGQFIKAASDTDAVAGATYLTSAQAGELAILSIRK